MADRMMTVEHVLNQAGIAVFFAGIVLPVAL